MFALNTKAQNCNLIVTWVIDDAGCDGIKDGAIGLFVKGGQNPYTYQWNNGATTRDISGLPAGTFTVTVTDAQSCSYTSPTLTIIDQQCCHEYPDLPPLSNQPNQFITGSWSLNHDLIIPAGYTVTFSACTLKINRGVQILLRTTAGIRLLNNSEFSACNKMWKGIYTEEGIQNLNSVIIIDHSSILDADKAIFVVQGYEISSKNSTFDNNIVGIETKFYPNFDGEDICDQLIVRGTNFIHSSPLKSPFVGQAPFKNKPFAGIIIRSFKLGGGCNYEIGNNSTLPNIFDSLNTGIQFINVQNPEVNNSKFTNISSENFYPGKFIGSAIYCSLDKAIHYNVQPLIVNPIIGQSPGNPTIKDCSIEIYTDHVGAQLSHLAMTGVNKGIHARNAGSLNSYSINNNYIAATSKGIELAYNYKATSINVSNNNIYTTSPSGMGIFVLENQSSIDKQLDISHNHVYCNGSQVGIGLLNINGVKTGDLKIRNNVIYSYSTLAKNFKGIKLERCSFNEISGNQIFGVGPTPPDAATLAKTHAMFFSLSSQNTINCNTVDNTSYGIGFYGELAETDFAGNEMNHHFEGLHIHTDAVIGPKTRRGNTWLDPSVYVYGGNGAVNLNTGVGGFNLPFNEFKYQLASTTNNVTYLPTTPGFNIGWFTPDPGPTFNCCPTCTAISNSDEITQLDISIASGDRITSEWPEESLNMAEMYLYKKLTDHPELLSVDPILQSFYNSHSNLAAGVLNNVADRISAIDAYTAYYNGLINLSASLVVSLSDSIGIIDSLSNATGNYAFYDAARNLLLTQVNTLTTNVININLQLNAFVNNAIIDANLVNGSIIPVELPEINGQAVNELYLQSLSTDFIEYSPSQVYQLFSIAQQCPYAGGPAVYMARAIYHDINDEWEYDDISTCLAQGIFRTTQSVEQLEMKKLVLKPNPASDKVEIQFNPEKNVEYGLEIFDNTGRYIKKITLPSDQPSYILNISELYSGLYVVKLKANNSVIDRTKLLIIK